MTATETVKRVHKKPEQRQQEILAAATTVFADRGYQCADVQAIADLAGVGKGTVYRHFETKENLFHQALSHCLDNLRFSIEEAAAQHDDPLEKLKATMYAYLSYFEQHPEIIELFSQERAEFRNKPENTQYFIRMQDKREEWLKLFDDIKSVYPTRDITAEDMMDYCGLILHGSVVLFQADVGEQRPTERFETFLDMLLNGIMKPAG